MEQRRVVIGGNDQQELFRRMLATVGGPVVEAPAPGSVNNAIPPTVWEPGLAAEYRCTECSQWWTAEPGPTTCPLCGCLYVVWINHPLNIVESAVRLAVAILAANARKNQ